MIFECIRCLQDGDAFCSLPGCKAFNRTPDIHDKARRDASLLFQPEFFNFQLFCLTQHAGIKPPFYLTAMEDGQNKIAKFALLLGGVALDTIVKVEQLKCTFAIPDYRIKRGQECTVRRLQRGLQ